MSENRTLPLPGPGPLAPGAQEHARAARRRLHAHRALWMLLTAAVAIGAMPRLMPPALSPVLAALGIVLAARAWLRARVERSGLLAARGPAPATDLVAAVTWRADPRGPVAEQFRRAGNWWLLWVAGAVALPGSADVVAVILDERGRWASGHGAWAQFGHFRWKLPIPAIRINFRNGSNLIFHPLRM